MSEQAHYILLIISGLVIFSSLFIRRIHHSFLSEPVLVMLVGLAINLAGLEVFRIEHMHSFMNGFSRVVIVVALISTALRIRHAFIKDQVRNLSVLVLAGMVGMWFMSSLIIFLVFDRDLLFSMLAGAMITPTDPVVASSLVSGKLAEKLLPEKIRSSLSFEAGANDGLAFPMVMLPFLLIQHDAGEAWKDFFLKIVLWENVASILLAGAAGYFLGWIYRRADQLNRMDQQAIVGFSIAMTFFIYALFEVVKANSIVSVFAAGVLFNSVISQRESVREESVQEVLERLLVIPIFFLFGLFAPWKEWDEMGWGLLILAAGLILLFRRLPVLLALKPFLKGFQLKDILLMGWFGPIGVAAIFYVTHIYEKHPFAHMWTVVSFMIFASTVVHGLTRYYISKWYHRV